MSDVAGRLRLAREQAGLSQGQVAHMLKMHRPTISEIEAGRRRISAEEVATFARIYEVDVAWLLGQDIDSNEFDDRVQLAARELAKLRDDDLNRVLSLLSSMKRSVEPDA